ncbi:Retrovirus-related pol polyprotein from transposon tnt 1-94 [Thalictrum thalictroides]|uniref:Retrovirus-related pol polyprotein from transposon tnt 1-94 n=1 Tax=Thalictrum thalictroides TaxID=46969 RepID=A0A7J6VXK8_THATH|nr:Retrovirus-related pol polyprotein from transposon tnt 1-94 [Thalictrum thalictroides]
MVVRMGIMLEHALIQRRARRIARWMIRCLVELVMLRVTTKMVLCLMVSHGNHASKGWVLYSGCIHHMCPRKEWCTSSKVIDGGMVVVGNNIACRAIEIGTFELKMHDGVVRTMEVRHIFGLEPNIISLGFLESHGYEFIASGGVSQVFYGYLVAMMGKRHGNLCYLEGGIMVGADAMASSSGVCSWSEGPTLTGPFSTHCAYWLVVHMWEMAFRGGCGHREDVRKKNYDGLIPL